MPGIFAYYLVSHSIPSVLILIGAYLHISAMHIFSAIPDIEYDKSAGITTTPVYIGERALPNSMSDFLAWIIIYRRDIWLIIIPLSFLVFLYPIFPLMLLLKKRSKNNRCLLVSSLCKHRSGRYIIRIPGCLQGIFHGILTTNKFVKTIPKCI